MKLRQFHTEKNEEIESIKSCDWIIVLSTSTETIQQTVKHYRHTCAASHTDRMVEGRTNGTGHTGWEHASTPCRQTLGQDGQNKQAIHLTLHQRDTQRRQACFTYFIRFAWSLSFNWLTIGLDMSGAVRALVERVTARSMGLVSIRLSHRIICLS